VKKFFLLIPVFSVFLFSCSKDSTSFTNTCEARINGELYHFNVSSVTMTRTPDYKDLSITAISPDSTLEFTVVVRDTAGGGGMTVKDYVIRHLNEDDAVTTEDESIDSDDVQFSMISDQYTQNGKVSITSSDALNRQVTGTFELTAEVGQSGGNYQVTDGKFSLLYAD
jgi:hypothetical protein